jgi:ABC-type Fe3+-hydroxamate transport system substrate-binding protein/adenosylcobinamide amidohydrolase
MRQKQKNGLSLILKFTWDQRLLAVLLCCCLIVAAFAVRAEPVEFTDDAGSRIVFDTPPQQVVSLVPSVTEIIFALGAGERLKGVTAHTDQPAKVHAKQIVGGYFAPCVQKIEELDPELIFVSSLHDQVREYFADSEVHVITLRTGSVEDSFREIKLLARILEREKEAADLVEKVQGQLDLIQAKTAKIPDQEKKRVIRLMGRDRIMTPGSDSFQNEFIRMAGGIPPQLDREGAVVSISKEEWQEFDPQVIYGCGGDRKVAEKFFSRPGWKNVQAVQDGNIFWFPCDLTCRAATNSGDFVAWLASRIYTQEFSHKENLETAEEITGTLDVDLELDYAEKARIASSRIGDFENKTLIVQFSRPMRVVSTLEGQRRGISCVGNHFSPPPCWSLGHHQRLETLRSHVYEVIGVDAQRSSFLFTGADIDNLAVSTETYQDMSITALITAGVTSNALRMSRDVGSFYEPGTINIILLPNMQLSQRAMTRAIISATEAKTAALQDLDIRSSYTETIHQATGTGTDNVLVAEGFGPELDNAGGHSKLGELISKAVYAGVKEAIEKQNGISAQRSVFHRLQERGIDLYTLVREMDMPKKLRQMTLSQFYCTLLEPKYASFVQAALTLSDERHKGLLTDISSFEAWSRKVASEISGNPEQRIVCYVQDKDLPQVLAMALNAVLTGVQGKTENRHGAGS